MKIILSILSFILLVGNSNLTGQNSAPISFEKTVHDFGRIKEDGGKVSYNFKFKNTGKQPIIIKNVQSSCGCTTPDWTKTPVLPGKEGFVSAEFDPIDRPSSFNKQIMVYNNITNEPITLEIKGDVIPKTRQLADLYRYSIGDLRLNTNHLAFARISNTEKKTQSVDVVNDSDKPLTIALTEKSYGEHLKITASPSTLQPKASGKIIVEYDGSKKKAWGFQIERIILIVNGTPMVGAPFTVSATLFEDFSKLSPADIANAPTMDFNSLEYDFGTIKQGETVNYEYKFKNNGKRDLLIRETQSSCGCTAVESKNTIKPGESSSIKVTFHSAGKSGKQSKTVTLITNIPGKDATGNDKNKIVLRIKGEIK